MSNKIGIEVIDGVYTIKFQKILILLIFGLKSL
jgi:hypothetical protein